MKLINRLVMAAATSFILAAPLAQAHAEFNAKAFFDKLEAEKKSFDSKAFFERLAAEAKSNIDAKKLFEKLESEAKSNETFDASKLWARLQAEAKSSDQMATMIGVLPSKDECTAGYKAGGRWDEAVFTKLCAK
jgi:hypothetical protein